MAYQSSIFYLLAVLSLLVVIRSICDYRRRGGLPYPPGPRPLPIIGNLLDIPRQSSWLAYSIVRKDMVPLSLSYKSPFDIDARENSVLPTFWAGHRRVELR